MTTPAAFRSEPRTLLRDRTPARPHARPAQRRTLAALGLALGLSAALVGRAAYGLPALGSARPDTRLVDAWDRTLALSSLAGMPVLVLYEDKASAEQNLAFKRELSELAKDGNYKRSIALVAVADVGVYDYWPIRGFVKSAIRDESAKFKTVIYCDWNGEARGAFAVRSGVSSVLLYGKDGKAVFAHEGAMPAETRKALIELLKSQIAK